MAKILEHKDIRMTQRYAHHSVESLRSGVDVLDRFVTIQSQLTGVNPYGERSWTEESEGVGVDCDG